MYPNLIPNFNPFFLNFKSSPVSRTPPKNPIQKNNPISESEKTGMMGPKHLHELLEEDQEPFLLKNYIFDRRSQLNKPIPKTKLQPKKFRPRVEISNPKRSLWKQACFASLHQSPEVRKSPWPATAKLKSHCNCKRQNTDLLLEAARRITQNQSTVSKPKTQIKNGGFGLFGSVLKRLRGKNRPRNREIGGKSGFEKSDFQMGFGCDCNNSRRDSFSVWSEKSEGKSRGVETCRRWEEIIIGSGFEERENGGDSPFRFSLRKSTSSSPRKTDFSSPATSPVRCDKQEKCGTEGTPKIQLEEEKEQKEQCSPVSVLDPPFEDDEDGREDGDDADGYDLECSYAIVQRAKQKLLEKLLRFEKLAELDPIELEKRMLEDQEDDDDDDDDDDDHEVGSSLDQLNSEKNVDRFLREVLIRQNKDSGDMRRLVIDLIAEEKREEEEEEGGINDSETVVKRVCERLDSWKEVESNTIDMMVELDFRRQVDGWKRIDREQVVEIAGEIEIFIFGLLEEELYEN